MARRIGYIRLLLALYLAALILSPRPATAADPAPGDACTAAENAINTFQWNPTGDNGTPAAAGVTNAIFCIGNVRKSMMNFQAATGYVGIGNTAPGSMLDVGKAGTTLGTLRLEGNTSGYVQLQTAAAAGSWTMTLPPDAGTSGYLLKTNGAGVTSWVAASAGTPAGANTQVQFNSGGSFGASTNYTWNNATQALTIAGSNSVTNATSGGTAITGIADTGAGVGVYGQTSSTTDGARGVYGYATSATGVTYGVHGQTLSTTDGARGVYGYAIGATGATYGVYGLTTSTTDTARGVYGYAAGATGATYGVFGLTPSTTDGARGVYGRATGATGVTYGVYGTSASNTGFGGYFTNTNGGYALATGSGNVGIGTTTPKATLDVSGYAKLKINASAPVACSATYEGSIAYTGTTTHYVCFCNGTGWVQFTDNTTACTW